MLFLNREDAAQKLTIELQAELGFSTANSVVGLARGGVPIAYAIAMAGSLPCSTLLVDDHQNSTHQIFVSPFGNAMVRTYNGTTKSEAFIDDAATIDDSAVPQLLASVIKRQKLYNDGLPTMRPRIFLCDDGIVSGKTVRFASKTLRQFCDVERIVLVTPVIPKNLSPQNIGVDEIVFLYRSTLENPPTGMFYEEFKDVPDEDIIATIKSLNQIVMVA